MPTLIACRTGIVKVRHKLSRRCVALLQSFLGLFFFTRQRIWWMVCWHSLSLWHVMASIHICLLVRITGLPPNLPIRLPKHADEDGYATEGIPLRSAADGIPLRSPRAPDSFRSSWCPAEIFKCTQIMILQGLYSAIVGLRHGKGRIPPPFITRWIQKIGFDCRRSKGNSSVPPL